MERLVVQVLVASDTQWEYAAGGMGPPFRTGLRYSDVRAVAEALGLPWNEWTLDMIRAGEGLLLSQDREGGSDG